MYACIDAVGVDKQPRKNANAFGGVFCILVFVVGNMFIVNMFAAVLIDCFSRTVLLLDAPRILNAEA